MSFLLLVEQIAPQTPSANQVVLYPKSDGLIYQKDDAGTERVIAQGIATQAQQEAGTDVTVAVTSGRQKFHPSAAKGWIRFNGTGTVENQASYNVTSLVDNATGNYSVNWDTDFSSGTGSSVVGSSGLSGARNVLDLASNVSQVAASSNLITQDLAGTLTDADIVCAVAFGDQ